MDCRLIVLEEVIPVRLIAMSTVRGATTHTIKKNSDAKHGLGAWQAGASATGVPRLGRVRGCAGDRSQYLGVGVTAD